MIIKKVNFIKSAVTENEYPDKKKLEVAFIGRSNVGKSSLINAITNRKKLAIVSKLPGRTRLINFFLLNENLYLVDLPGYGFANLPISLKNSWKKMIENYLFSDRKKFAFILIDIRRDIQKEERQLTEWLTFNNIPFCYIFTKSNKIGKNLLREMVKKSKNSIFVSYLSKDGIQDILKLISYIIDYNDTSS